MKNFLIAVSIALLSIAGCAASPADNDPGFQSWTAGVVEKIKAKPDYRRLPLDSAESQKHFIDLNYKAYKKELSADAYRKQLNDKYPGYAETVDWLTKQLPQDK